MTDVTTTISTSGVALRTPQEANVGLAVIHGSSATWPTAYTKFSSNFFISNPTEPPALAVGPPGLALDAGNWSVSYAWADDSTGTHATLPSPPATITLPVAGTIYFTVNSVPSVATYIIIYLGLVDNNGYVTRVKNTITAITSLPILHSINEPPEQGESPENTTNTTVAAALIFGRADDESGNTPVSIPQATPTTSYSWYKSIQAVISVNGLGNTNVTNISICQLSKPSPGLNVFYRVVSGYVRCNGSPGLPTDGVGAQTGNYPPDDLTPHTGNSPNTPAGYTPLPITPIIVGNGPYFTGTAGPIGPVVQLVLGLADRTAMTQAGGQLTLPAIALYFDET
jgi:hypothetical protein